MELPCLVRVVLVALSDFLLAIASSLAQGIYKIKDFRRQVYDFS